MSEPKPDKSPQSDGIAAAGFRRCYAPNERAEQFIKFTGKIILLAFVCAFTTSVIYGEEGQHREISKGSTVIESLSPELRKLLSKEMQEIEKGMMTILPAYASGNWSAIEAIGTKMERSYILMQSITDAQKEELHNSLPSAFIKLDQQFHYYAGMLSHAAKNKKSELIVFYFSRLSESCVSCHSQYATHKFRGFVELGNVEKHSH